MAISSNSGSRYQTLSVDTSQFSVSRHWMVRYWLIRRHKRRLGLLRLRIILIEGLADGLRDLVHIGSYRAQKVPRDPANPEHEYEQRRQGQDFASPQVTHRLVMACMFGIVRGLFLEWAEEDPLHQ